ncbi:AAA family ATPase [Haloprofundus sp. MHR1]|uniref:AAA family ATPase n=1 Tax=Haloprofundus sp. MHR1 TaxID=2572921 RepID=UPI0010BE6827|nr:AAA family ATPase [Haloprofundus sp. MHR1]QCJ47227.1 chromosome segregation protein [Haloprofundus sp. MHR1]
MNNVQIFEIEINEYRQYSGKQVIDLEANFDQHLNIIEGQNGSGKSNILNAITLCFYGEETHTDSNGEDGLESDPLVTKKRLRELDPGESAQGHIEIKLGKDEPKYAFRRTFTTARHDDVIIDGREERQYNSSIGELRLRQRFGGNDWKPNPSPQNILREILPTHVHEYFLFDGEQLDNFFKTGYTDHVRAAVLDVSHIELLNEAVKHLGKVQRDFESDSSELGGDIPDLQQQKETAADELEGLKEERKKLEKEIETAEEQREKINNKLAGSADDDVREMQQRRAYLETRLDEQEDEVVEDKEAVGTSLAKAGGVGYNADALSYAITQLEEYESSQNGLPGLTEELLRGILSRDECVCGADLDECDSAREHIEELLEERTSESQDAIEGRLRIERALKSGTGLIDNLLDDLKDLEETRTSIDENKTELKNISGQLEGEDTINNERAQELEARRRDVQGRIDKMQKEVGELGGKIDQQDQVLDERRDEWKQAMREQDEQDLLIERSEFLERASNKLNEIKVEILEEVREDTESCLEQFYNDLIWKDEDYEIVLTEDYEIKLYDPDGRKGVNSLSAGERQVLALSFMAALSEISGFSAPVVIDTPLGRISSEPKQRIAQNVPNYLEGSQVTFLMTDVEYSEDVRVYISNDVANEYHLDYQNGVTEVVDR